MADAVATVTVTKTISFPGAGVMKLFGTLAIDADPAVYVANGIDFSGFTGLPGVAGNPLSMQVEGLSGYIFKYVPSTGKLMIFDVHLVAPSPLEELTDAAIPAAISGDTIDFVAEFLIGQ